MFLENISRDLRIVQRLYLQHVPRRRFPVAGCHRFYYHRENNFRPISESARQCATTVSGQINRYFTTIFRRIGEMPVKLESDLTSEEHYGLYGNVGRKL